MGTITLPNFRVSGTDRARVRLKDGGVYVEWSSMAEIKAWLYSDEQKSISGRFDVEVDPQDRTRLLCVYAATKPQYLGVNRILLQCKYNGADKAYDKPLWNFVRWTADQAGEEITIDDPEVDVEIVAEDMSSSVLDEATAAALAAADKANEAAEQIPLQVLTEAREATAAANTAAAAANAAGITSVQASIADNESGTPSVDVALLNKVLSLVFHHLKGVKGDTGATPNIEVGTVTTGEPGTSVIVEMTGTAEAPVLNITIPQGAKGEQGNTGSSVDYPFELVNNLTTDDATKALTAAQGVKLDGKISQLQQKVSDISTGKYYGYYASANDLPDYAAVDGFAYVGTGPTYTIYNCQSGAWASSGLTVNQSPVGNEEDIDQDTSGKLQFADRVYNAQQPDGMGYVILRKNKTFAEQVTEQNTIYEIRYDFDLGGASVEIPSGCKLYFNGGKIVNGSLSGTIENDVISSSWFQTFDDFIRSCNSLSGYSRVDVPKGNYSASVGFSIAHDVDMDFNGSKIVVNKSVVTFIQLGDTSTPEIKSHLTSEANKGDFSIVVSDASPFARGDLLFLRDKTTSSYNTYRNYQEGEIVIVDNIDGNTIYLSKGLFGTYPTANLVNCVLYKPSMHRCNVRNLDVESNQTRENNELTMLMGFCLMESQIKNIRCNNFDIGILVAASYNVAVYHCDVYTPLSESSSSRLMNQYGVSIANSQSIRVSYINGICGNHLCSIGGTYSDWQGIVSRLVTFDNCVGKSLHPYYPGINVHGDGEYVTISNCHTNGIDVGGNYITIKDCDLSADTADAAIRLNEITGLSIRIVDCTLNGNISNSNHIENTTVNRYDESSEFIVKNCVINASFINLVQDRNSFTHKVNAIFDGNVISGTDSSVFCNLLNQQPGISIKFSNNLVSNFGLSLTDSGGVDIAGNTFDITNTPQEVIRYSNGSLPYLMLRNNILKSTSTRTFRFDSRSVSIPLVVFEGNHIDGVELSTRSTAPHYWADILVFRNNVVKCTSPFYISGKSIYANTTPTLGNQFIIPDCDILYDGTLMNIPNGLNVEKLSFASGTQDNLLMVRGRQHGGTSNRPANVGEGTPYYDMNIHKQLYFLNNNWLEYDGQVAGILRSGDTASRPTTAGVGFIYFDTDLGKPIWRISGGWVDATGTEV